MVAHAWMGLTTSLANVRLATPVPIVNITSTSAIRHPVRMAQPVTTKLEATLVTVRMAILACDASHSSIGAAQTRA